MKHLVWAIITLSLLTTGCVIIPYSAYVNRGQCVRYEERNVCRRICTYWRRGLCMSFRQSCTWDDVCVEYEQIR